MENSKFGFIGCGNMGGSLARAVVKAVGDDNVTLADKDAVKAQCLAKELKCEATDSKNIAKDCKFIFLGIKPQVMKAALSEISDVLNARTDRFVIISMAAGVKMAEIAEMLGKDYPIIRIMPNTPVSAGKGMILYTSNKSVNMDELESFCDSLQFAGRLDKIQENSINAATAVSGCGPAFVYLFAEAMADAGVECGLPREKALEYATQTLLGSAELIFKTGKHPAVLKDEVCSPGGSTIEGVHSLEENGFRGTVMSAVKASFDKTNLL
ncbi:MAG: pyrroline-5-carboxylate reductase [Clostridia bacterium]|nr:pyrroline-5-carboxylate reductase [Clostridia bacterium]